MSESASGTGHLRIDKLDEEDFSLLSDEALTSDRSDETSFPLRLLHGTGDEVLETGVAGAPFGMSPRISALLLAIE